jgi:Plasmid pRiA4b ORF-3-like protein
LNRVAEQGSSLIYVYDFGDYWRPKIVVEKVFTAAPCGRSPRVSVGGGRVRPRTAGEPGVHAVRGGDRRPDDEEHESMLEWVGGQFDPEAFDPSDVDRLVHTLDT